MLAIYCCVTHTPNHSRLEYQHSFPLLIIAKFGRAWQAHSSLAQTMSASLTQFSKGLAQMAGKWYWLLAERSARSVDRDLCDSSHRAFHGLLGSPHTIVSGFQEQVL